MFFGFLCMNCVPLSITIAYGVLNLASIFLLKKFKTFVVAIFSNASALVHLVKYSTTTNKYLSCLDAGKKGSRMSIPYYRND